MQGLLRDNPKGGKPPKFAFCIQFSSFFLKGKNTKGKRGKGKKRARKGEQDALNNSAAQVFYIGSGMGPGPAAHLPTAPVSVHIHEWEVALPARYKIVGGLA